MVGAGDDLPRYQAQVVALGLRERVVFHAADAGAPGVRAGRIIVVPSRAEAMPYIVLEALAAGMPMIATAVGGIPEIFGRDSPRAGARRTPGQPWLEEMAARTLPIAVAYRAMMPSPAELSCRFAAA